MSTTPVAIPARAAGDRLARAADGVLRWLGDARVGVALLLVAGAANALAALVTGGSAWLASWPYALLLGAVALSGIAAVAVRAPATWREWRRPAGVVAGRGALSRSLERPVTADEVAAALRHAGYRVRDERRRGRWAVHGVRRGWSRLAGHLSHLALVVIVLGAAIGAAFGSETSFSLFAGDQALLDAPEPGFSSAVRLESFDAAFGADGRPTRLDTQVTFMRDGEPAEDATLRVNEPGAFDGYLVHPWTYGPAARIRVTTLAGSALLDAPIPLDELSGGVPVGSASLPTAGVTLGLSLADAEANVLGITALSTPGGVEDQARLRPGEEVRLGVVIVRLEGFDAWVTFLSRRDPGLAVLFGGAALLCVTLAVGFWLPRRRVTVRTSGAGTLLLLRGELFDRPVDELDRLSGLIGAAR